jgi:hypothetical protein
MQKTLVLILFGSSLFCTTTSAQQVNKDSLSLISKIEADQSKLVNLQSQLDQKIKSKEEALAKAQQSANINATAADKLSDNPRSKRLAKRAHKRAGEARQDAKNARKESAAVDKLNKDIRVTKKRIAKNQKRLNKYLGGER